MKIRVKIGKKGRVVVSRCGGIEVERGARLVLARCGEIVEGDFKFKRRGRRDGC